MGEIYLDNSATTRAYDCVGELVKKVMCEDYGNPSSMHAKGVAAEQYIKEAKETFAKLLKGRCHGEPACRETSDYHCH